MTNLSISDGLNFLSEELQRCLSPQALHQRTKEVGFVQRTNKYRAQDLVALCVWLNQRVATTSLNQLCSRSIFIRKHRCKEIEIERLECHLYGQLIGRSCFVCFIC